MLKRISITVVHDIEIIHFQRNFIQNSLEKKISVQNVGKMLNQISVVVFMRNFKTYADF